MLVRPHRHLTVVNGKSNHSQHPLLVVCCRTPNLAGCPRDRITFAPVIPSYPSARRRHVQVYVLCEIHSPRDALPCDVYAEPHLRLVSHGVTGAVLDDVLLKRHRRRIHASDVGFPLDPRVLGHGIKDVLLESAVDVRSDQVDPVHDASRDRLGDGRRREEQKAGVDVPFRLVATSKVHPKITRELGEQRLRVQPHAHIRIDEHHRAAALTKHRENLSTDELLRPSVLTEVEYSAGLPPPLLHPLAPFLRRSQGHKLNLRMRTQRCEVVIQHT
mmetsp:Transcript_5266/g.21541  ORF Transcript_5266/g.21541 Transcript_5266/m.21541 type:complete len:273 (-) Transcript_5266:266-1084(-)